MNTSKGVSVNKSSLLAKVKSGKTKAVAAKSTKKSALASALKTSQTTPRLLFAMDATGSREPSWQIAQTITLRLFQKIPAELEIALAHFGGGRLREVTPYTQDANTFVNKVKQVECEYGGTSINAVLAEAAKTKGLKALVLISDCFEENSETAYDLAKQLKLSGVKCFIFHDRTSAEYGYDVRTARKVFATIIDITGGHFWISMSKPLARRGIYCKRWRCLHSFSEWLVKTYKHFNRW